MVGTPDEWRYNGEVIESYLGEVVINMSRILEVKRLEGGYGTVQILHGLELPVEECEFVTIIGPNGC